MDTILFIHSTINGNLCCFHSGAVVNHALVNNGMLPRHYTEHLVLQNTYSYYTQFNLLFKLRWNLHNIKLSILKQTIQWRLVTLTVLCSHHLYLQNIFITPNKTLSTSGSHFPLLPFWSPWQLSVSFLSLWIYQVWVFHINGIIAYFPFVSDFFHSTSCFWGSSML